MYGNQNNVQAFQAKLAFESVGQTLKEYRCKLGCSQKNVADRLGYLNCNFMSMIEKGRTGIPANRFIDFMNAYEVPPEMRLVLYRSCFPLHWEALIHLPGVSMKL
jgi:transcriptional regulator with XRE-family HTH domain